MQSKIFAIGGALKLKSKNIIINNFISAVGRGSKILIIPSSQIESEIAEISQTYCDFFAQVGLEPEFLNPQQIAVLDNSTAQALLTSVQGVFFSGGSQSQLVDIMRETALLTAINLKFSQDKLIIAGTSAGCAALSEVMIARGLDKPEIAQGLGFINTMIMDQHFSSGNQEYHQPRFRRLLQAVYQNPKLIGVGVDENTAAIIVQEKVQEVIGEGAVTIIDVSKTTSQPVATEPTPELAAGGIKVSVMRGTKALSEN